eukprot:1161583-Pelagomonas_calceolata.AAC.7
MERPQICKAGMKCRTQEWPALHIACAAVQAPPSAAAVQISSSASAFEYNCGLSCEDYNWLGTYRALRRWEYTGVDWAHTLCIHGIYAGHVQGAEEVGICRAHTAC